MLDNIKLAAKIIAKISFKSIFIMFIVLFCFSLYFFLGLYASWDFISPVFSSIFSGTISDISFPGLAHTGNAGGIALIMIIVLMFAMFIKLYVQYNFCAFLLVFGAPLWMFLYSNITRSYTIESFIYELWNSKARTYITIKVEGIANRLTEKIGWRKDFSDGAISKVKLLKSLKDDTNSSKIQKKIIKYGFKMINLEDVNFDDENLKLTDVIMTKFNKAIDEIEKPSLKYFWILLLVHTLLVVGTFIIK